MEILDLLNEKSVSGAHGGRASLSVWREVLLFEKVSQLLRYDSNIFLVHKHIYTRKMVPITRRASSVLESI